MNQPLTRRTFSRDLTIGVAAVTMTFAPLSTEAGDQKPQAEVEHLLAMLQARFPDRLNDDQWKQVRGKIEGQLRAAEELRKFALTSADEPATVFAAYRRS
jgi:hypothetical protein